MKEKDLHFIWKFLLFDQSNLKTSFGESIQILNQGTLNFNQGPDFFQAKIRIGTHVLVGQIELHLNNKDWYLHKHQLDKNYDNVILHVCLENTDEIYTLTSAKTQIPILCLDQYISQNIKDKISQIQSSHSVLPCENIFKLPEKIKINQFKTSLFTERMIRKSSWIQDLIIKNKKDYESTFYQTMMYGFGIKVNSDIFLSIAQSIPQKILAKYIHDSFKLEAMIFGQANMIKEVDEYSKNLNLEYLYLKKLHNLVAIENKPLFAKMLPSSFPSIRLAQFVGFIHNQHSLYSKLVSFDTLSEIRAYFNIQVSSYWEEHYDFGKKYSKKMNPKISDSFFEKILINIILPFKFLIDLEQDKSTSKTIDIYSKLKPEFNIRTKPMTEILGLENKSAFDSQALNEWNSYYCSEKKCLDCTIGFHSLKTS